MHCGFGRRDEPYDVASAICQVDAPIICLQEVWRPGAGGRGAVAEYPGPVADAAAKLNAVAHYAHMCYRPSVASLGVRSISGPGELGIAVLTTLPVTDYSVIMLGRAPADSVPRVAQVIDVRLPGGHGLRIINTHLTYALTSPLQLRRLLAATKKRRTADALPTVIAGDLNMPRLVAARTPGFTAPVRGPTYPSDRPRVQLDHLLAGRGIGWKHGAVLADAGSDHLPIRAQLTIG